MKQFIFVLISLMGGLLLVDAEPDPMCPYPSKVITYHPDPSNCSQFLKCFDGKKYVMHCPDDLFWNKTTQVCDYPSNVDCSSSEPDPMCPYPSEVVTYHPDPSNCSQFLKCFKGKKYVMHCPDDLFWNKTTQVCDYPSNVDCSSNEPDPMCPYPSEVVTYHPDPSNCSQFLKCFKGKKYVMHCPDDLFWNKTTQVCDYPSNVDCSSNEPDPMCPYPSEVVTYHPDPSNCSQFLKCFKGKKYVMHCPDDLFWNKTTQVCDYPSNVDCSSNEPDPMCPYPSEVVTYHPDPSNCSQFLKCFDGKKYVMHCPDDLFWNKTTQVCDYPSNVDCSSNEPDPMCPYPSKVVTYHPDPSNCSQFLKCFKGKKYVMHCPDDLFWNKTTQVCDYPSNVDCNSNGLLLVDAEPDPMCPYPSDVITFYPDPSNCSQFFECFEGNKYVMHCQDGLFWNNAIQVCDYPSNVDCSSSVTTPSSPTAVTRDPQCPYPSDQIIYDIDPYNCSRFYECYQGFRYSMRCPGDLYWNHIMNYCDDWKNVDCSRGKVSTVVPPPGPTLPPSINCAGVKDGTFFEHPTDPTMFYECVHGRPIPFTCPQGTVWNESILACENKWD